MKKLLVLAIALVGVLVACGGDAADRAAIEDTIRGYIASYNASNFDETLTYFTGYDDGQDALSFLAFVRPLSGELTLVDFDREAIAFVAPAVPGGATAKVPVEFIIQGDRGSQMLNLKKEEGKWKILWEQESLP